MAHSISFLDTNSTLHSPCTLLASSPGLYPRFLYYRKKQGKPGDEASTLSCGENGGGYHHRLLTMEG